MPTTRQWERKNSMFWMPVDCFFPDFLRAQNNWFELSRVKLYQNDLRGNKNNFELVRGSSSRGFELLRVKLQEMYDGNPGENDFGSR